MISGIVSQDLQTLIDIPSLEAQVIQPRDIPNFGNSSSSLEQLAQKTRMNRCAKCQCLRVQHESGICKKCGGNCGARAPNPPKMQFRDLEDLEALY